MTKPVVFDFYESVDDLAKRCEIKYPEDVDLEQLIIDEPIVAMTIGYGPIRASGHAICSREDVFNEDVGARIALARAMRAAAWMVKQYYGM